MEIFISHSSKDADIAEALIDLLRAALNLPSLAIRCTSVTGYRLSSGVPVEEQLRQEIHEAKILIGLITNSSLNSPYVLFELGARWGAKNFQIPLLAGGVSPNSLPGPLKALNALDCADIGQIQQLVEDVAKELNREIDKGSSFIKNLEAFAQLSKAKSLNNEDANRLNPTTTSGSKAKLGIKEEITLGTFSQNQRSYSLAVTIINNGEFTIRDYRIEVEIPNAFTKSGNTSAEVKSSSSQTHRLFRNTNKHFKTGSSILAMSFE